MKRYHSLDALRASMMLLGLVLHSMASYGATPLGDGWPFQDAQRLAAFDYALYVIHLFRMPAFFAVAGFFAALLYARDGEHGFIRNRARRVLAPLFIFWAAIGPLVLGGFYFAITYSGLMTGDELIATTTSAPFIENLSPLHLWFLWFLVLFYAATAIVVRVIGPDAPGAALAAALTTRWWTLPLWTAITCSTMLPMSQPGIDFSPLIFAAPRTLIAYSVFFVFGWLLFQGRTQLDLLRRWWSWRGLAFVVALTAPGFFLIDFSAAGAPAVHVLACVMVAGWTWWLVLASFALFLRYASHERRPVRYLSDAAYWMYIVHLPIVLWTAGALSRTSLPAAVKFTIVLSVTTVVCLVTYQLFVRRSAIGALLNGRRHGAPPLVGS